jgi:hypothetical protein
MLAALLFRVPTGYRIARFRFGGSLFSQYLGHFLSERGTPTRPGLVACTGATRPSTGERPLTLGQAFLPPMPAVGPPQATVLAPVGATLRALRGRVNVRPLCRAGDACERTRARQFRRGCGWLAGPHQGSPVAREPCSEGSSAPAAACLPIRGQQTFGRGHGVTGWTAWAARGLEGATRAVVEVTRRCAGTRAVAQPPRR